jgi:hypothetical protein
MLSHRQKPRAIIGIGVALVTAVGGCALPDYHLPSGFSSTYYRHLQQSQEVMQAQATEPIVMETPAQRPWLQRWWSR